MQHDALAQSEEMKQILVTTTITNKRENQWIKLKVKRGVTYLFSTFRDFPATDTQERISKERSFTEVLQTGARWRILFTCAFAKSKYKFKVLYDALSL